MTLGELQGALYTAVEANEAPLLLAAALGPALGVGLAALTGARDSGALGRRVADALVVTNAAALLFAAAVIGLGGWEKAPVALAVAPVLALLVSLGGLSRVLRLGELESVRGLGRLAVASVALGAAGWLLSKMHFTAGFLRLPPWAGLGLAAAALGVAVWALMGRGAPAAQAEPKPSAKAAPAAAPEAKAAAERLAALKAQRKEGGDA